ncbi:alpha/beta fold hydrolase [Piscinibacter gummiphilus]|uniref:2-hydroxy-6-oxo-2,4-heptadienoate hydrolase n=1 Tax=Piscinibacter gummiphilus TaxID=946333 RepID=A0A1W6L5Y0_9BURK|nr:alpha/beta hydrolase [Piscinibacter gummiphilus]ARN19622.1 2-hydroxy-6-oxo-2,4-heptadienoate hydrolase [Piscinibacter gummiphilus]ATU64291.1 2-hydroxy-6-oxo-2,4-heptadienoate hydrolase [Piscinibacter gummiphilus]GLS93490.1 2,6-dioxo-6-phenylhexa-3-enoate hydrolase [Piscinibacter gummiphilus]
MSEHPGIGRTLVAAEHETNYFDEGRGKPLFLLHGSGPGVSAWTNWAKVMPDLAKDFRVIAPDIAGFGFTEFRADSKYDIKLWVKHLVGILDALGIEKASFVGNSFGGALSVGLALFAPQRVDRLVLLGTPAGEFEQTPGLRSAWEYEPSLENMERTMRLFPYDQSIITPEMVSTRYEASARPGAQDALRKLLPKPNTEGPTIVRGFPKESLEKITAPTLVLHGREDRVVPVQCGLLLANSIPRAELHLFGQSGHWVQTEHRERFLQLVRAFVA